MEDDVFGLFKRHTTYACILVRTGDPIRSNLKSTSKYTLMYLTCLEFICQGTTKRLCVYMYLVMGSVSRIFTVEESFKGRGRNVRHEEGVVFFTFPSFMKILVLKK